MNYKKEIVKLLNKMEEAKLKKVYFFLLGFLS